jgi:hypothetical protein
MDDDLKIEIDGEMKGMAVKNCNLNDELSRVPFFSSNGGS